MGLKSLSISKLSPDEVKKKHMARLDMKYTYCILYFSTKKMDTQKEMTYCNMQQIHSWLISKSFLFTVLNADISNMVGSMPSNNYGKCVSFSTLSLSSHQKDEWGLAIHDGQHLAQTMLKLSTKCYVREKTSWTKFKIYICCFMAYFIGGGDNK